MFAPEDKKQKEIHDYFLGLDRTLFLEGDNPAAYLDCPLPIGHDQTISQPSLVLFMTIALDPDSTSRVLEIGTGSGYQTALLARFAAHVYTIERIPQLAEKARARLDAMGFTNITGRTGDGSEGWPEYAPFDRIMVTAGARRLPSALLEQLKPGGKMIAPIGSDEIQELLLFNKKPDGILKQESLGLVRFVEFKGRYGD